MLFNLHHSFFLLSRVYPAAAVVPGTLWVNSLAAAAAVVNTTGGAAPLKSLEVIKIKV